MGIGMGIGCKMTLNLLGGRIPPESPSVRAGKKRRECKVHRREVGREKEEKEEGGRREEHPGVEDGTHVPWWQMHVSRPGQWPSIAIAGALGIS